MSAAHGETYAAQPALLALQSHARNACRSMLFVALGIVLDIYVYTLHEKIDMIAILYLSCPPSNRPPPD